MIFSVEQVGWWAAPVGILPYVRVHMPLDINVDLASSSRAGVAGSGCLYDIGPRVPYCIGRRKASTRSSFLP